MTASLSMLLDREALTDRVYETLRRWIIDLRLQPGEHLKVQPLARELGVSATPIREALNRLVSERLARSEPYIGFTVAPLLDADGLHQLLDARRVIEHGALVRAGELLDTERLSELDRLVEEMDRVAAAPSYDTAVSNALDAEFHRAIVAASGNPFLLEAYVDLKPHVQIARHFHGRPRDAVRANSDHRRLVDALRRGDVEAAMAEADRHLDGVFDRLTPSSQQEQA